MNLKEIKEMINLMNEHNLSELEVEREGLKLRLKKGLSGIEQKIVAVPHVEAHIQPLSAESGPEVSVEEVTPKGQVQIKSPMVGTFYRAPAPDAAPYVEEDQEIEVGHVVCIIEAMKLMNEIKSEVKGKIVKILVENAEPVEFGQVLFHVEPSTPPR